MKLECNLPDREEYIVFCDLTPLQNQLYKMYVNHMLLELANNNGLRNQQSHLLQVISILRKIVNHPDLLYSYLAKNPN